MMGAFELCKCCGGAGCFMCPDERCAYEAKQPEPIFSGDPNKPEDMEALKSLIGMDALKKAFGLGGDGIREIEERAIHERFKQAVWKHTEGE